MHPPQTDHAADEHRLSESVEALLVTSIRSLDELEILLRLRAERRECTAGELAALLDLSEPLTVTALRGLLQSRLVMASTSTPLRYRFAPDSTDVLRIVDQLAQAYATDRIELIMLISSKAIERVRASVGKMLSASLRSAPQDRAREAGVSRNGDG